MPEGTCDPASRGDEFNVTETAEGGGDVLITIRWGWDGVSVRPDCDGPVRDIHVRNVSQTTYYANLPNKKKGNRNIEIPPGTDVVISGTGQLKQYGLENYSDCIGVQLHTDPLARQA